VAEVEEDSVVVLEQKGLDLSEQLKDRPKKDLIELANGIFRNEIFTDRHISEHDTALLPNIFMPLIFMDEGQLFYLKQAGMIYAYMDTSLEMGINGYPIFGSLGLLNKDDAQFVWETYNKINQAVNSVLEG
jgi:hypothetical protein